VSYDSQHHIEYSRLTFIHSSPEIKGIGKAHRYHQFCTSLELLVSFVSDLFYQLSELVSYPLGSYLNIQYINFTMYPKEK